MDKEERLKKIVNFLSSSKESMSGSKLASLLGVTRQVVVQDVAILKSRGINIISTARGYVLNNAEPKFTTLVAVQHTKEMIRDELTCVVKNGGEVIDVIVEHPIYGEIRGSLNVRTLGDVEKFITALQTSSANPLLALSNGVHLHTIGANTKEALQKIIKSLEKMGILI